jgi:integrase/recombinase XerD
MTWTVEKAVRVIQGDKELSPGDKKLILKFVKERSAVANLSDNTILKLVYLMKCMTKLHGKGWNKFKGRKDVVELITKINEEDISIKTKENLRQTFKQFYRWFRKNPHPPEIEDVKVSANNHDRKLPENMLEEADIMKMVNSEKHVRNKAILMTLWCSGARAAELLGMKIKDVQFDDNGARVRLSGKTGDRYCRVVECAPYIHEYIDKWHQDKANPEAPLWVMISNNGTNRALTYPAFKRVVEDAAHRCNIQKPCHPHAWRASRATYLAKFLTSSQLKVFFGWRKTAMCDVYISMHTKDVDESILKLHGKVEEKNERSQLTPITCPRCKYVNGVDVEFCRQCEFPLTPAAAVKRDEKRILQDAFIRKWMLKDPAFKKKLQKLG